ncbi:MAG: hypothetical protein M1838_000525 [Thelocarpon superellum]|nr:MAG: hypothetical protein M1838_000525 [Thelocarpon superellum]
MFGDSYTTTNFNPAGTQPSSDNPLGNDDCPHATNYVYDLATIYNSTLTLGYNYAVSGATIDAWATTQGTNTLKVQVEQDYRPLVGTHPAGTSWTPSNSLVGLFIGINDVDQLALGTVTTPFATEIVTYMTTYFNIVEELYTSGQRNFFFITVPPLQHSPMIVANAAAAIQTWTTAGPAYNTALAVQVQAFAAAHSDVVTHIFDSVPLWTSVLGNPIAFGFKDNITIGAWDDKTTIWTDTFHPGNSMNNIIAQKLSKELHGAFNF